jgi:hypothetical protein
MTRPAVKPKESPPAGNMVEVSCRSMVCPVGDSLWRSLISMISITHSTDFQQKFTHILAFDLTPVGELHLSTCTHEHLEVNSYSSPTVQGEQSASVWQSIE